MLVFISYVLQCLVHIYKFLALFKSVSRLILLICAKIFNCFFFSNLENDLSEIEMLFDLISIFFPKKINNE